MKIFLLIFLSSLFCEASFDKVMDELNLSDTASMDQFRSRMIHILNTEEISINQLQMILAVLTEMNQAQPTVYFDMVGQELQRLQHEVLSPGPTSKEEYILIFKKRLPLTKLPALRTTILKIPLQIFRRTNWTIPKVAADSESAPVSHAHREIP